MVSVNEPKLLVQSAGVNSTPRFILHNYVLQFSVAHLAC